MFLGEKNCAWGHGPRISAFQRYESGGRRRSRKMAEVVTLWSFMVQIIFSPFSQLGNP
jgi:hypothetical protein